MMKDLGEFASEIEEINQRILPYRKAPAYLIESGRPSLQMMNFSLIPAWSKDPKPKFATHNARLETVLEKPTWQRPFRTQRCVVPISEFYEPIYTNELAGNMVTFEEKSKRLLYAAGLWDQWINKETGEVIRSFTILTDDPPNFIENTGHDRCPIFITTKIVPDWLDLRIKENSAVNLLRANRDDVDFVASIDRPLAAGWEKRIPKD